MTAGDWMQLIPTYLKGYRDPSEEQILPTDIVLHKIKSSCAKFNIELEVKCHLDLKQCADREKVGNGPDGATGLIGSDSFDSIVQGTGMRVVDIENQAMVDSLIIDLVRR